MQVVGIWLFVQNQLFSNSKDKKDFFLLFFVYSYARILKPNAMRKGLCFIFVMPMVVSMIPVASQPCANPANIYSFTYNGKTYEVVKEMKNWTDAAACSVERGGYLVEINDEAEQDAVYDGIINGAGVSPTYTSVPDGGGVAYVWIGATDKETEGAWYWDGDNNGSGSHFWQGEGTAGAGGGYAVGGAYVNWGGMSTGVPNEPDNFGSGQDAAAIALAGWPSGSTLLGIAGEWNDLSITNSIFFVIEIGNTGIGEPGNDAIKIYPNPVNDLLTVQPLNPAQEIQSLRLLNILGRSILVQSCSQGTKQMIRTGGITSGMYLLSVVFTTDQQVIVPVAIRK